MVKRRDTLDSLKFLLYTKVIKDVNKYARNKWVTGMYGLNNLLDLKDYIGGPLQ